MEEELKCPVCKHFFSNPVLLPCYHSLCLNCALHVQAPAQHIPPPPPEDTINNLSEISGDYPDVDKLSLVSETDSGVVCNSRPNSYVGTPNIQGILFPPLQSSALSLSCPVCQKIVYFDENGAHNLPKNRALQNIVDKYGECKNLAIQCQLCEGEPREAAVMCEQCEVFYCDVCRDSCHPARGPLAKHSLVSPQEGKATLRAKLKAKEPKCLEHSEESLSMYCMLCKVPVCVLCLQEGRHISHDVQALGAMCKAQKNGFEFLTNTMKALQRDPGGMRTCIVLLKNGHPQAAQFRETVRISSLKRYRMFLETRKGTVQVSWFLVKHFLQMLTMGTVPKRYGTVSRNTDCFTKLRSKTELSQNLQALSEKARGTTEFIQGLKVMSDKVSENCTELESAIEAHCVALIEAIHSRRLQLVEFVRKERDYKLKSLRDQVASCTTKLQHTTGLLQFCIEALKETDPTAFLQVGSALINRVSNVDVTWHKEMTTTPWVSHEFDLTLDHQSVLHSIEQMTFAQMKPPGPPLTIPEECTSENNSITIAWQPDASSFVEGYILELDDGNGGAFREVYCGKETICTVDGLHFNSVYNARVKAYNSTGEGLFCDPISLQTAEVAWFALDPITAHPDIVLSNENQTVTCDSYEHRVALGNIGFSRGVHYWEFTVDRYDNNADPAFGIARFDVVKDLMLGKDDKGWSMYIDHQRSWFLHADNHENRTEGGIEAGSVVGVLLDLERHQLSFYVNDERQGPVAFLELHGVFFPAVSINRNVQVTVQTALDPPTDSEPEAEIQEKVCTPTSPGHLHP